VHEHRRDFLIGFSIFAVTLLFVLQMISGSVVSIGPESESRDTLARTGVLLISNWSDSAGLEAGVVDNESAKESLDKSDDDVADNLSPPPERENSYNVTVENALTERS